MANNFDDKTWKLSIQRQFQLILSRFSSLLLHLTIETMMMMMMMEIITRFNKSFFLWSRFFTHMTNATTTEDTGSGSIVRLLLLFIHSFIIQFHSKIKRESFFLLYPPPPPPPSLLLLARWYLPILGSCYWIKWMDVWMDDWPRIIMAKNKTKWRMF